MPQPAIYLFLHHSAGLDGGPRTVAAIQRFHQAAPPSGRGWSDIAYTWLYSPRDRVFYEGRGPAVAGAHTQGYNQVGHAVCVLGNYDVDFLPDTAVEDLAAWAAWHRETKLGPDQYTPHSAKGATACPGSNILRVLPRINDLAADRRPAITDPVEVPKTVKRGSGGENVRYLQGLLGLTIDGKYGPKTEAAVKAFQTEAGLVPDGIVGPATWRALIS